MHILFSCTPTLKSGREYNHWINKVFSQIILNYKTKRADSLSFYFLVEWLLGDITNLTGCLLANQLPQQTATAIYFVMIDLTLFIEYVWYGHKNKSKGKEGKEKEKERLLTSDSLTDFGTNNPQNKGSLSINEDEASSGSTSESVISIKGILGLIGLGSITYFGIFSLTNTFASSTTIGINQRNLLAKSSDNNAREIAGKVIGWISGFMYLSSRIPQIIKNFKRKSTEGLSIQMFLSAILGNLTYAFGIFLRSTKWDFIRPKIPWLVGSIGTCGFDCTIFSQFLYYRKKGLKPKNNAETIETLESDDSETGNTDRISDNNGKNKNEN
ncbi:lysosomal amino acid transporter [Anaeramoeba flamelloides]|uniref:Lysosomal amino acid transporter n=1 Tax=Anaeramoeba flamelloides TaxID=1746091 RepID=A0AAV7YX21_9EUKA|nr:lysosomal amino acid transporter [Anaeramoeba flamelloides]